MDKSTAQHLFTIVDALEDVKAKDIRVFTVKSKATAFRTVVVATGSSNRQTRALGHSVWRALKKAGQYVGAVEGNDSGEWVLVDCGDTVVHCLQPEMRDYYALEELWGPDELSLEDIKAKGAPAQGAVKHVNHAPDAE